MRKETMTLEEKCSSKQILSFNYAIDVCYRENLRFTDVQQRVLGIRNAKNRYTNLGLWISDQNPFTTKVILFKTDKLAMIEKTEEFTGSLLKQYEEIMAFLKRQNKSYHTFIRGRREDILDYPPEALSEAVLNMLIHRDYKKLGSCSIHISENQIEMCSLGGLPANVTYDELFVGSSVPRNKCLANFFKHVRLASGNGEGISKIRDNYSASLTFPKFRVSEEEFKVILPNQQFDFEDNDNADEVHLSLAETTRMLVMLELLHEKKALSKKEIQECLQVSSIRGLIILEHLVNKGLLEVIETEKGKRYCRPK